MSLNPSLTQSDGGAATYCTPQDPALRNAWRYYNAFDENSNLQKRNTTVWRRRIILLSLFTTSLAAIATPFGLTVDEGLGETLHQIVLVALILLPILVAGALAFAQDFVPSLHWVISRVTAETIRREIYLYRTQAAGYDETAILNIIKNLRDPNTTPEKDLPVYVQELVDFKDKPDANLIQLIRQRRLNYEVRQALERIQNMEDFAEYLLGIAHFTEKKKNDEEKAETTTIKPHTDDAENDNGWDILDFEEYVKYRVLPQHKWYLEKSKENADKYRFWRGISLLITVLGTAFAAFGFVLDGSEIGVVITTALGIAVATYIQLKMFGQTYDLYYRTATQVDSVKADWEVLSPEDRNLPKHRVRFITQIENIFQSERTFWIQRAIQSQIAAEAAIVGNIDEWVRSQFGIVVDSDREVQELLDLFDEDDNNAQP